MTKITKPGVYDLDEATYHGDPCLKQAEDEALAYAREQEQGARA